jgi:hypothetical protein
MRRTALAIGVAAVALAFLLGDRKKMTPCEDIYEGDELLEDYAEYVGQAACDPSPKPGVVAFRKYVLEKFGGGDVGIARGCSAPGTSEHEEGRAWDWGIVPGADLPGGVTDYTDADVAGFLEWLFCTDELGNEHANARRAGVMYLIHDRKIWRAYDKGANKTRGRWLPYTGADPHTAHLHISFSWAGAQGETSLYRRIAEQRPDIT